MGECLATIPLSASSILHTSCLMSFVIIPVATFGSLTLGALSLPCLQGAAPYVLQNNSWKSL